MSAAVQHKPHKSGMTFWSRNDPVRMPRGNTDNWAKLRVRSTTYQAHDGLDGISLTSDTELPALKQTKAGQTQATRFELTPQGRVRRLPDPSFPELVATQLHGQLPGNLAPLQPSAHVKKSWLDNPFQQRARQNFRYWLIERPAPTKFGRYGVGSFKTVLGVGNAPRT